MEMGDGRCDGRDGALRRHRPRAAGGTGAVERPTTLDSARFTRGDAGGLASC